jgi:hypothetical protein
MRLVTDLYHAGRQAVYIFVVLQPGYDVMWLATVTIAMGARLVGSVYF